jgi:hypothetical protein
MKPRMTVITLGVTIWSDHAASAVMTCPVGFVYQIGSQPDSDGRE